MQVADLDQVERLMELCFANPWSTELLQKELHHPWSTVFVAETESRPQSVVGVGVFWKVHDELSVLNVATHPEVRRMGLGRRIMEEGISLARNQACTSMTLEVRKSNEPAIQLYLSLGFQKVGLRRNYYVENREDAVLMTLKLAETR